MERIIVKGTSAQEMISEMNCEEVKNIDFYRKCIELSCDLKKRKLEMIIKRCKKNGV